MSSIKISLNCCLVARQVLSSTETYRTISWNLLVNTKVIAFRTIDDKPGTFDEQTDRVRLKLKTASLYSQSVPRDGIEYI